jgi:hypothetical protein
MITLSNTKYGTKRKAIIGGVTFNILAGNMEVNYIIQLIDGQGNLLDDPSLNQNRFVTYAMNNETKVDAQFNVVNTGGKGEYDYFFELMQTMTLPNLILQLGNKLNERGIFN